MISYDDKIIFIHLGKNAGTSLGKAVFGESYKHDLNLCLRQLDRELDLPSFFKFCFVRNPWDRAVSIYFQMRKAVNLDKPARMQAFTWANSYSFPEFVRCVENQNPRLFTDGSFREKILIAKKKVNMDFIGRFENLEEDYLRLASLIPVKCGEIPHLNRSERGHYREYYDRESRLAVGRLFEFDIHYLGYRFES